MRRSAGNHTAAGTATDAGRCTRAVAAPQPAGPIRTGPAKVGLLVPLSGPGAALGADLLDAAQLALFDVGRTDLELLPRDTGDQPPEGRGGCPLGARRRRRAAARARSTAARPVAVAPLAAAAGVSVISFSNDASVARPGLYVLGFRPEEQIERIVAYAAAQGRTRFAALAPDDAYGARVLAAWRAAVAQVPGATAAIAVTFPPDSETPTAEVQQVAAFGRPGGLPPDAPRGRPGTSRCTAAAAADCCRRRGSTRC